MTHSFQEAPISKIPELRFLQQVGFSCLSPEGAAVRFKDRLARLMPEGILAGHTVGNILDTADQELTLVRTQRQTLDQQKRGLIQRLLTGKIRVKP